MDCQDRLSALPIGKLSLKSLNLDRARAACVRPKAIKLIAAANSDDAPWSDDERRLISHDEKKVFFSAAEG
jgi:hypothetical protein